MGSTSREPSSEISICAGPGSADGGDKARSAMVSLGTGLPPLPKKLVERIQANEYVDFAELPPARGKGRLNAQYGDN